MEQLVGRMLSEDIAELEKQVNYKLTSDPEIKNMINEHELIRIMKELLSLLKMDNLHFKEMEYLSQIVK